MHLFRRAALFVIAAVCAWPAHALYDPVPNPALALVQGEWVGALTYRDYQRPDRMVTLPTRVFVALSAPDAIVLHYVFDDGPGKTVYSYELMRFDFAGSAVTWITGDQAKSETTYRIVSNERDADVTRVIFEGASKDDDGKPRGPVRFTVELSAQRLMLKKEEIEANGTKLLRNTFTFARSANR